MVSIVCQCFRKDFAQQKIFGKGVTCALSVADECKRLSLAQYCEVADMSVADCTVCVKKSTVFYVP